MLLINCFKSWQRKEYFSKLILITEDEQKRSSSSLYACHSSKLLIPKKTTSSTKSKWVMESVGEIWIPWILSFLFASPIRRLIPSIKSIKSKGKRGQPCLIPLDAAKNFEGVPLISTAKFVDEMHPIIHLIARRGTPIWISMSVM